MKVVPIYSFVNFKKADKKDCHAKSQKKHFLRRFRERVGYTLTNEKYQALLKIARYGKLLGVQERGSTYLVDFEGLSLKIVYNIKSHTLVTVLR